MRTKGKSRGNRQKAVPPSRKKRGFGKEEGRKDHTERRPNPQQRGEPEFRLRQFKGERITGSTRVTEAKEERGGGTKKKRDFLGGGVLQSMGGFSERGESQKLQSSIRGKYAEGGEGGGTEEGKEDMAFPNTGGQTFYSRGGKERAVRRKKHPRTVLRGT